MQTLAHVTVLDLSQGIAGPAATALLASQGARVIKVEPLTGDWIRGAGAQHGGQTSNAIVANLRKQSLAVDATRPEGRDLLLDLAAQAQVLVQNFRPGVAERLGLGFDTVQPRNPALVYASISGFGDSGPRVAQAATDSVLQAYTGLSLLECCAALQAAPIVDAQIAAQAPPVAALLAPGTVAERLQRLTQADVLCSAIHTHAELLADAQVQHMGDTVQVDQPPYGQLSLPQLPGRPDAPTPAPACGEHSVQVLRRCGVDEARIGALLAAGVVLQANLNATDPSGP